MTITSKTRTTTITATFLGCCSINAPHVRCRHERFAFVALTLGVVATILHASFAEVE